MQKNSNRNQKAQGSLGYALLGVLGGRKKAAKKAATFLKM